MYGLYLPHCITTLNGFNSRLPVLQYNCYLQVTGIDGSTAF